MTGEMLLHDETLVILSYDGMTGYDVSDPSEPQEKWKIEFNGSDARRQGCTTERFTWSPRTT